MLTSITVYGAYMLKLLSTEEHKRSSRVNEQQIDDSEMVLRLSRTRVRKCAVSGVVVLPHGFEAALAGNFVLNSTDSVPDDCPVEISRWRHLIDNFLSSRIRSSIT